MIMMGALVQRPAKFFLFLRLEVGTVGTKPAIHCHTSVVAVPTLSPPLYKEKDLRWVKALICKRSKGVPTSVPTSEDRWGHLTMAGADLLFSGD